MLNDLRAKDRVFKVKAKILRLLPEPNPKTIKYLELPSKVKTIILDSWSTKYGTEEDKARVVREKERKIRGKQTVPLFCFEEKNGQIVVDNGDYGLIHRGLYRVTNAMKKGKFWDPPIDLISIRPEILKLGKKPPERTSENAIMILEPRSRKTTRQLVAYEAVENRTVEFEVVVNQACPLSDEEILTLLHGLETVRIGHARRGHLEIIQID